MRHKTKRKNAVKWNLAFQYLSLALGVIKGFLIVPIYFLFIDTELYGYWVATGSILVWINIIDPGAGTVLQQKVGYEYGNKNINRLNNLIGSGIIIGSIICGIALIFSYTFSFFIPQLLGFVNFKQEEVLINAFNIAAIGACFSLVTSVIRGVNYGMQNTKMPGLIEILASIIGIGVNVVMLYLGYGLYSIAFMLFVNGVLTALGNLIFLRISSIKYGLNIHYSFVETFPLFKEFTYTFFSRLVNTLTSNFDLIIIARFIGAEMVTVIEMTRRPFKMAEGIVYKPAVALSPAISHLQGENKPEKLNNLLFKFFHFLIWAYCLIISGFLLFNQSLITLWLSEEMFAGILLSLLIVVGLSLKGFFSSIGNLNFALGDIKESSKIIVAQNLLYVVFVIVLGKFFGIIGILAALLPSVLFTSSWYHLKRLKGKGIFTSLNISYILKNLFLAMLVCVACYYLQPYLLINNWFDLISYASIYVTIFLIFFATFSKMFRTTLIPVFRKII
ncbi:oligosaccharide flippase family protein [Salegentibacter sp. JZCK2]|uniref:lipopolysaccharide biosynthesis protein n=1 Tax=Salegentibacter tibetensis TaxID=2873600 RepID=UPI001CCBB8E4|nr:oligosaccharide flippase family protein [Salegentibacter tibetensis]MBZ9728689.1 oligosaccharide flippase family protein [Salegentibacter tibetensis]